MNINYLLWMNVLIRISGNKQNVLLRFLDFCCMSQVLDLPPVANDATMAVVKPNNHAWEF